MTTFLKQTSYPLLLLLILVPSKGWIDLNLFSANILIGFVIVLNLIFLKTPLIQYLKELSARKYLDIETIIFVSIVSHFMISQRINIYALSFLVIYFLSRLVWINFRNPLEKKKILNAVIFFGFFLLLSVFLGFIETILLSSNVLSATNVDNYPNPIARFFNHSKGMYYSYNATAYSLAFFYCSISFLSNNWKNCHLLKSITLLMLFLTQAKFAYLFIACILLLKVFNKSNKKLFFFMFSILIGLYISASHLVFGLNSEIYQDEKYYHSLFYQNENFSVYLSLFSELKAKSLGFLNNIDLLRPDLNDLVIFLGDSEPHNLFISAYFFGGIFFLLTFTFLIIKVLYQSISKIKDQNLFEMNFYLLFILLSVESLVWDSYDSLIFLLVLTYASSNLYQTKESMKIKDNHS